jgi:vacuolar-type H+-ATPase subunit F/Vma7
VAEAAGDLLGLATETLLEKVVAATAEELAARVGTETLTTVLEGIAGVAVAVVSTTEVLEVEDATTAAWIGVVVVTTTVLEDEDEEAEAEAETEEAEAVVVAAVEDATAVEEAGTASFLIPNWVEYWYWPVPSTMMIRP